MRAGPRGNAVPQNSVLGIVSKRGAPAQTGRPVFYFRGMVMFHQYRQSLKSIWKLSLEKATITAMKPESAGAPNNRPRWPWAARLQLGTWIIGILGLGFSRPGARFLPLFVVILLISIVLIPFSEARSIPRSGGTLIARIQFWMQMVGTCGFLYFEKWSILSGFFVILFLVSIVLIPLSDSRKTPGSAVAQPNQH
jgi:hypothetical protein